MIGAAIKSQALPGNVSNLCHRHTSGDRTVRTDKDSISLVVVIRSPANIFNESIQCQKAAERFSGVCLYMIKKVDGLVSEGRYSQGRLVYFTSAH